ncbi:SLATT domain-containing protein [Bacillus sp. SG-1]|uniref:SLATT domain-containing protein n=1 Tax=Bacillus sp. SG-1 TaxID=161544 RepID=UPI0001543897|nr:SLATT domain-containing protein [Bacillus sp. SG-1]EDL65991.1 hypothetical protein BSG1_01525 [Bacillus sp. SG-1]
MKYNYRNLLEVYAKVVYTHKTHEKAVERLENRIRVLKILQIVLLSLTSVGVLSTITDILKPFIDNNIIILTSLNVLVLLTAFTATGLSIYDLSSSDKEDVLKHKTTAIKLLFLREKYIALLSDYRDKLINNQELVNRRDTLNEKINGVYSEAPQTHHKDFVAARKALKINEEFTFNEGEVEKFLPVYMRDNYKDA